MTQMQTPRRRHAARAALAFLIGLGLSAPVLAPAFANEPMAPAGKSRSIHQQKKWRKGDVTIIIIDEDDRSRSTVPKPKLGAKTGKTVPAPSSRIDRDDDNTRIIIRQTRKTGKTGSKTSTGPKVIIVDKNTDNGCSGSGVCVIRP
ncbi:hypothetical protein IMCC20628_04380 [Hoeflea sp. IMCC20628]|uniref:hypothetical protein n=1 Tax=Hoeflea sp. IMCC20628 TaxID=1620421 RepID=UPI00063BE461|nr:hypothetical protein [Hoeflea sp. IMCC20628]AKI03053.1 hypothetical protein IMCC20628_04380 [Hoeflea sp. IMCC20628]